MLPNFTVPNWTGAYSLHVACKPRAPVATEGGFQPLVRVYAHLGGPMDFNHSMTPDQAREMAASLLACADAVDPK